MVNFKVEQRVPHTITFWLDVTEVDPRLLEFASDVLAKVHHNAKCDEGDSCYGVCMDRHTDPWYNMGKSVRKILPTITPNITPLNIQDVRDYLSCATFSNPFEKGTNNGVLEVVISKLFEGWKIEIPIERSYLDKEGKWEKAFGAPPSVESVSKFKATIINFVHQWFEVLCSPNSPYSGVGIAGIEPLILFTANSAWNQDRQMFGALYYIDPNGSVMSITGGVVQPGI